MKANLARSLVLHIFILPRNTASKEIIPLCSPAILDQTGESNLPLHTLACGLCYQQQRTNKTPPTGRSYQDKKGNISQIVCMQVFTYICIPFYVHIYTYSTQMFCTGSPTTYSRYGGHTLYQSCCLTQKNPRD